MKATQHFQSAAWLINYDGLLVTIDLAGTLLLCFHTGVDNNIREYGSAFGGQMV